MTVFEAKLRSRASLWRAGMPTANHLAEADEWDALADAIEALRQARAWLLACEADGPIEWPVYPGERIDAALARLDAA